MTKIEQVARAMYREYEWGLQYGQKELMHDTAKRAIEAMREPTKTMVAAGLLDPSTQAGCVAIPSDIYKAMIDAALKE